MRTNKHTNRKPAHITRANKFTYKQTHKQINKHTNKQIKKHTNISTNKRMYKRTNLQTEVQTITKKVKTYKCT